MHRFWIYPLCGSVAVFFWVLLSHLTGMGFYQNVIESLLAITTGPMITTTRPFIEYEPSHNSLHPVLILCAFGTVFSFIFLVWDLTRNLVRDRTGSTVLLRLTGNLSWCLVYGAIASLLNSAVICAVFYFALQSGLSIYSSPILGLFLALTCVPYLFQFLALCWGFSRTVTQTDVLSPRVLKQKLGRTAQVESK